MPDSTIRLRPAALEDSRRIWAWRNEPSARAASFNSTEIPFEEHDRWFSRRITTSETLFFIAAAGGPADGRDVGYVRFNLHGSDAEISVCLDPAFRGRGLGRQVIDESSRQMLREQIEKIPDGEYVAPTAWLDDDARNRGRRLRVETKVIVEGDSITIDAVKNELTLNISPKDLKARLKAWQPKKAKETRGILAKYAHTVTSASEGAVTDKYL